MVNQRDHTLFYSVYSALSNESPGPIAESHGALEFRTRRMRQIVIDDAIVIGVERRDDRWRRTMASRPSRPAVGSAARASAGGRRLLIVARRVVWGGVLRSDHPGGKAQCHQRHADFGSRFHCVCPF